MEKRPNDEFRLAHLLLGTQDSYLFMMHPLTWLCCGAVNLFTAIASGPRLQNRTIEMYPPRRKAAGIFFPSQSP
jgi:hypothetical protein